MSTDYRTLCAELVDAIGSLVGGVKCGHYQQKDMWKCREIFDRARAALAQPEPVAPTDEEIMELMPQQMRDDLAQAARALAGFTGPNAATACRIILNRHAVDHSRAALAKWGHQ